MYVTTIICVRTVTTMYSTVTHITVYNFYWGGPNFLLGGLVSEPSAGYGPVAKYNKLFGPARRAGPARFLKIRPGTGQARLTSLVVC